GSRHPLSVPKCCSPVYSGRQGRQRLCSLLTGCVSSGRSAFRGVHRSLLSARCKAGGCFWGYKWFAFWSPFYRCLPLYLLYRFYPSLYCCQKTCCRFSRLVLWLLLPAFPFRLFLFLRLLFWFFPLFLSVPFLSWLRRLYVVSHFLGLRGKA